MRKQLDQLEERTLTSCANAKAAVTHVVETSEVVLSIIHSTTATLDNLAAASAKPIGILTHQTEKENGSI